MANSGIALGGGTNMNCFNWVELGMADYVVRAALSEETNNGWIWIGGPSLQSLGSRKIVTIKRPFYWRRLYVEVRKIDRNFLRQYNCDPTRTRKRICCSRDTLVVGEWYRVALGIEHTSATDKDTTPLVIAEAKILGWRSLRAACCQPDLVVKLGARLGVMGAWLGLLGTWLGVLGVWGSQWKGDTKCLGFALVGLLLILGVVACWDAPRYGK